MEHLIEQLDNAYPDVRDNTEHFLLLAQRYIEGGETEMGKACLVLLTRRISNYEEIIELEELTALWEQYKPLVADLIEPSVSFNFIQPLSPEKCTLSIPSILSGSDDDLLTDLSTHLNEMSANGDCLSALNKWERTAWYADELCMEVNSGGFQGYLYYHGTHFDKAYKAISEINAPNVTALLDSVRAEFPRTRIPKSEDAIQNAIDKLEDKGINFEDQDDTYYTSAERELLTAMTTWVRANAKHFR